LRRQAADDRLQGRRHRGLHWPSREEAHDCATETPSTSRAIAGRRHSGRPADAAVRRRGALRPASRAVPGISFAL